MIRVTVVCTAMLLGCSDTPSDPGDAGSADDATRTDAGAPIEPPASPMPPRLAPCPDGWREVAGPIPTCEPWPEGGPGACAPDERWLPGDTECTTIGTPCDAADPWASDLPTDAPIHYVRSGAAAGGDGSRAAPLATIADALRAASAGDVVALSKGTFDEVVTITRAVTLVGACVGETRIASSAPDTSIPTVTVNAPGTALRNLQVGGARPGIVVYGAGGASLDAVLVRDAVAIGVGVVGTMASTARDLVVRDVAPTPAGTFGRGIDVEVAGVLDAERVIVERTREFGAFVVGEDARLTIADAVIRDVEPQASDGAYGRAIRVAEGAELDAQRVVIERTTDVAISASQGGAARITDAVIRDTRESGLGGFGRAIDAYNDGHVELRRALLERNVEIAASTDDPRSTLSLEDVVVRSTRSASDGRFGRAIGAQGGASLVLTRVAAIDNHEFGVFATDEGSSVRAEDLSIARTAPQESDGQLGRGLQVQDGAHVVLTRATIVDAHEAAIAVLDSGTVLEATDVAIQQTASRPTDGTLGRGVHAQDGATVRITRALVAYNREVGVQSSFEGTSIELSNVAVRHTDERACATTTCPGLGAGIGLAAYEGGRLTAQHFVVSNAALTGIQIARDGEMDLSDGFVIENPIGANVQVPGYDLGRLSMRVVYRDNDVDLDATALPVPPPGTD